MESIELVIINVKPQVASYCEIAKLHRSVLCQRDDVIVIRTKSALS